MTRHRYFTLIILMAFMVGLLFCLSLSAGQVWINPLVIVFPEKFTYGEAEKIILMDIRLPRAILGVCVGAILALSGAVLQGLLRNPLAEPGLLGISASASLGAVLAIYTGFNTIFAYALPLSALGGALISVILLQSLVGKSANILTLILSGVALTTLASALTSLTLNLSSNPFASLEIVFWMLGSLTDRSFLHVQLSLPLILMGGILLFTTSRSLNALSLGQDVAQTLGVNIKRTYAFAIMGTAIGVGAATAVSGAIGFIGLVVPHLLRPLVGNRPGDLLPLSALGGAIFLLAADVGVRILMPSKDLKLGVVTALIGAPFFLWLLYSLKRTNPT